MRGDEGRSYLQVGDDALHLLDYDRELLAADAGAACPRGEIGGRSVGGRRGDRSEVGGEIGGRSVGGRGGRMRSEEEMRWRSVQIGCDQRR